MIATDKTTSASATRYVVSTGVTTYPSGRVSRDMCSGWSVLRGNFKAPNAHSYNTLHYRYFRGMENTYNKTSGALIRTFSGPLAGIDSNLPKRFAWSETRDMVYNMALNRLNEKVRGSLDLTVGLAEIGSTMRMLTGMRKCVREFSRLGTKDAANAWLQFQYGWRPMLSDIFGAANESVRYTLNRMQMFRARVTLPLDETFVQSRRLNSGTYPTYGKVRGKTSCTFAVRMRVKDFDIFRWMSLNPVSLGWELIPYSFVVDWVYDVGSYLRNLETQCLYNTEFVSGYRSELFAYQSEQEAPSGLTDSTSHSTEKYTTASVWKASTQETWFQRTPLVSYPGPRLPTFKVDLGSMQMLSAAALMRQRLG